MFQSTRKCHSPFMRKISAQPCSGIIYIIFVLSFHPLSYYKYVRRDCAVSQTRPSICCLQIRFVQKSWVLVRCTSRVIIIVVLLYEHFTGSTAFQCHSRRTKKSRQCFPKGYFYQSKFICPKSIVLFISMICHLDWIQNTIDIILIPRNHLDIK